MRRIFLRWNLINKGFRPQTFGRLLVGTMITGQLCYRQSVACNQNDEKPILTEEEMLELINRNMVKYEVCQSSVLKEGQLYSSMIKNEGKDYPIIIARLNGRVHSTSGLCTYDMETPLVDGICFGNKLYCPKHGIGIMVILGCQYDITTGVVEQAPAYDNLPKFAVEERDGNIYVYAPIKVPRKIIPFSFLHSKDDMRKVLILGQTNAAFAATTTLREMTYTGSIALVLPKGYLPYDENLLTKKIKDTQPEDFYFRPEGWYQESGIDLIKDEEPIQYNKKYQNNYILLSDTQKIDYDGLLVATGTQRVHPYIEGMNEMKDDIHYLDNLTDHQRFKEALKKTKKLTVIGINFESLEAISTIKKEYPNIEINLIEPNKQDAVRIVGGDALSDKILEYIVLHISNLHRQNKVNILLSTKIDGFMTNKKGKFVQLMNGKSIPTDAILMFPNNHRPHTKFMEDQKESLEIDRNGFLQVDRFQRTSVKRIFAAGGCSIGHQFFSKTKYTGYDPITAYQQGVTAAYNIMALNIPHHYIPYKYVEQYDKTLQRVGSWSTFDSIHVIGDIENWDFAILYSVQNHIVGAICTKTEKNYAAILNEVIRLQICPNMLEFQEGNISIRKLERFIRRSKRSGCFKQLVINEKDNPVPQLILWQKRDDWANYKTSYEQFVADIEGKR